LTVALNIRFKGDPAFETVAGAAAESWSL
jgi:hypothetical protein